MTIKPRPVFRCGACLFVGGGCGVLMPDTRKHRGAHPEDAELFGAAAGDALRLAVRDLSWLLSRGYAEKSSLKLVGDRYELRERQRVAVMRAACSDTALCSRRAREIKVDELAGHRLSIDGYNLLTTIEAAMGGGVILACRDGCYRDMASMHGTYRKVAETQPALQQAGESLARLGVAACTWYLDRPVSNSGRLAKLITETGSEHGWDWDVKIVDNPDTVLIVDRDPVTSRRHPDVVISADSAILDACGPWSNLARHVVIETISDARVVEMAD